VNQISRPDTKIPTGFRGQNEKRHRYRQRARAPEENYPGQCSAKVHQR
jgi:hypothetical protein